MKISNFRFIGRSETDPSNFKWFAKIDVTRFSWRRLGFVTKSEVVFSESPNSTWRFIESGEYTPSRFVENMYAASLAQKEIFNAEDYEVLHHE